MVVCHSVTSLNKLHSTIIQKYWEGAGPLLFPSSLAHDIMIIIKELHTTCEKICIRSWNKPVLIRPVREERKE